MNSLDQSEREQMDILWEDFRQAHLKVDPTLQQLLTLQTPK
jgi:hypothetical protein